ncbi:hypothetical protein NLC29_01860 [Candidatus Aminicenantes bacterium AH-873-B07]|jgi:hypothetical protein|nr:hypothetical protein [Candidatus Aminicenantes bacterium AH-873-B07]
MKSIKILTLLFILLFSTLLFSNSQEFLDISKKWKFMIDPQNEGIKKEWYKVGFDDSKWREIDAGKIWEKQGYELYDGVAWYRKKVSLPIEWKGEKIFIGFGGVDDIYDLYINGIKIATFGSIKDEISYWNRASYVEVTKYIKFGEENLIALRIYDWGGGGGISKLPAAFSIRKELLIDPRDYILEKAKENPDWLWPYWIQKKGIAWTMVGLENSLEECLRSFDGSIGATIWPFTLNCWILDIGNNKLYAPEKLSPKDIKANLYDGYLPISEFSFNANHIRVKTEYFIFREENFSSEGVGLYHIKLKNNSDSLKKIRLFVSIRPYLVNGRIGKLNKIEWNKKFSIVIVNDSHIIFPEINPDSFYAVSMVKQGDVSKFLHIKEISKSIGKKAEDYMGMASGIFIYNVKIKSNKSKQFNFKIPLKLITSLERELPILKKINYSKAKNKTISKWKKRLNKVKFNIPEKRYSNAYYASLAYILISMDHNMPHPGPLAYNYFWYRDSAYILAALLRGGYFNVAEKALHYFMKAQKPDGEFPSIFDIDLNPVGPHEWDAQGQALFALTEYYRFTKDKDLIRKYWNKVLKACKFLKKLRKERLKEEFKNTPLFGILPPSASAEDLGPAKWHHYWDDFWAIKGLYDASFLAQILGKSEDAKWIKEEANQLLHCTQNSYKAIMKQGNIDWIPNGPEDLHSSSMARGTSPGLWPGGGLNPKDPIVKKSFEHYFEKWIKPFNGAYLHRNRFWPYGLELAYCYLILNMKDKALKILDWHLDHQTFPENYSWAEQINPETLLFQSGDMPHCWVAADYINLFRALFIREKGNKIILGSGIKEEWLKSENKISIENAPTHFGNLSFYLQNNIKKNNLILILKGNTNPPDGYLFKFPFENKKIVEVKIDNKKWKKFSSKEVKIPKKARRILIKYK